MSNGFEQIISKSSKSTAEKVALSAVMVALAMIFSYVEVLIPFNFGVPGIKLGLSNLVVMVALYKLGAGHAFNINMVRIVLSGLLFGGVSGMIYSLAGGILSLLVMLLLKTKGGFSMLGVSIGGGVSHNVGQLIAAICIVSNLNIAYYLPVLMIAGVITGAIIGMLSGKILQAVDKEGKRNLN